MQPIGSAESHDKQVSKQLLQVLLDPNVLSGQFWRHSELFWKKYKPFEQEVQLFGPGPLHSEQEESQSLQL